MKKQSVLAITIAVVVGVAAAGWVAGSRISSPAEVAARTAAPVASVITVPVERRSLSSEILTRGTVRYGTPHVVVLPTSLLKPTQGVVTTAPRKGAQLREGAAALAVSGRPVLVLRGRQPAYRDLRSGLSGTDVLQLEEGLRRLRYSPGPVDGVFDTRTEQAVAAWYVASGWLPFGPTDEQLTKLRVGRGEAFQSQADLVTAREAVAAGQAAVFAAQERARVAQFTASRAPVVDAASVATWRQSRATSAAEVALRTGELLTAADAERLALLRLDEARTGVARPPTAAELDVLRSSAAQAAAAIGLARGELAAAEADAVASTALAGVEVTAKSAALTAVLAGPAPAPAAGVATARADLAASGTALLAAISSATAELAARQQSLDALIARGAAPNEVAVGRAAVAAGEALLQSAQLLGKADIAAKQAVLDALLAVNLPTQAAVASAREQLAAAQAASEAARLSAGAKTAARRDAVDGALAAKRAADLKLAEVLTGRAPPAGRTELAALTATLRQAAGAARTAKAALAAARASAAVAAPKPLAGAGQARLAAAAAVSDTSNLEQTLAVAQSKLPILASRAVAVAIASTGSLRVQVPADEVLFLPTLPARVGDVPVKSGTQATAAVMTVTSSVLTIDAALSSSDVRLIRKGASVVVSAQEVGIRASGSVTDVAATPGTRGVDPLRFHVEITPKDAPASLVGASVLLTINVTSTAGQVLVVPVSSISVGADGSPRVQVQPAAGPARMVSVVPGLAAQGLVEVSADQLSVGDLVVVGTGGPTRAGPVAPTDPPPGSATPTPSSPSLSGGTP